jgi:hypothetical protein
VEEKESLQEGIHAQGMAFMPKGKKLESQINNQTK